MRFAILTLALAALAPAQHDTTPPTLTAFSCTPTNPNAQTAPATVTCTATATDDLSGVARILVNATGPTGIILSASWAGSGGLSTTQTLTLTLPQYSDSGSWSLAANLWDAAGNEQQYPSTALNAAGFTSALTAQ